MNTHTHLQVAQVLYARTHDSKIVCEFANALTKSGLSLDEVKQRLTDTFDIVFTKYAREGYDTWFTDGHVRGTRTTLIYFSVFQQQWFYFSHGERR